MPNQYHDRTVLLPEEGGFRALLIDDDLASQQKAYAAALRKLGMPKATQQTSGAGAGEAHP